MSAKRKSVPLNTTRQLWAECGGYCQNPSCNKLLFREVGEDSVSIANVAHIIGHGSSGPRSDHELAEYIDRDGLGNLIMLCLECHKVVDELEKDFTVKQIKSWKAMHSQKIRSLFSIPYVNDEHALLEEVNDLLDINGMLFREYGPYSANVLGGLGGDGLKIWKKRCLDTILPNNQRIIALIENNKRNFPYPWDVYQQVIEYKIHADAFQDNCLIGKKINDYKLFPRTFDYFIKTKLGIDSPKPEIVAREELEFRYNTVQTFMERFLSEHRAVLSLQELNRGTMLVELRDGRVLKVFVTNTYYFTDYTLDRVLEVDPAVDAIICSSPAGQYSYWAKQECINRGIGLFMLGEFMGAILKKGDDYLNFLLKADREYRVNNLKRIVQNLSLPAKIQVFVFGSFIRKYVHNDVDLMIVHVDPSDLAKLRCFESELESKVSKRFNVPSDINVTSAREFSTLKLKYDNLLQIYP
jgi:predicted nucleotidyltransferase